MMYETKCEILKKMLAGSITLSAIPTVSAADDSSELPDTGVAIHTAPNENLNSLAFTAMDGRRIQLFVAEGTTRADGEATNVTQITDGSGGSVWNVQWDENSLEYWRDGETKSIRVSDGLEFGATQTVSESDFPPGHEPKATPTASPDRNLDPGGGGGSGDYPDWYYDPDNDIGDLTECGQITSFEVDFLDVCVNLTSVSPKVYTETCTGTGTPLIGGSMSVLNLTTPIGAGSVDGLDIWAGYHPGTSCLHWGSESLGTCYTACDIGAQATVADIEESITDGFTELLENIHLMEEMPDMEGVTWRDAVDAVFGVIITILALIFLAIVNIATGGAVGA